MIDQLHTVRVPVLVLNGRYDISQDFVCVPFLRYLQRVRWVTFESSSHSVFWEERERCMGVVGDFLETRRM